MLKPLHRSLAAGLMLLTGVTAGCQSGSKVTITFEHDSESASHVALANPQTPPLLRGNQPVTPSIFEERTTDPAVVTKPPRARTESAKLVAHEITAEPDASLNAITANETRYEKPVRKIDLATSLALVAGENPRIGYVQQRVAEACAELDAAEALWLPSVRIGANYNKHEGSFQDVAGQVLDVSRGSLYTGFGSRAVGASSPAVPGVYANFHLADAIFQPIIAQRTVQSRQFAAASTENDLMLQAALAHLELVQAVEAKRIAEETLKELQLLADLTASFAKRGQGTQADADRALTERNLQQNVVTRAEERIGVASARLADVLSLEDGLQLAPAIPTIVPVELISEKSDVQTLVAEATANRPEISENLMEIDAASQRYERERYSPFIPNIGAGISGGGYGGGVGDTIRHYQGRFDADAWAYWEVRNLGFGEKAARDAAQARVYQQQFRRTELLNRIRREVTAAHARLDSARRQLSQTNETVKSAEESYKKNQQRIRNAQGLPLEVLQSIQALDASKREKLNAKAAYNRAQFELQRALGWAASK